MSFALVSEITLSFFGYCVDFGNSTFCTRALEIGQQLLSLAEDATDPRLILEANCAVGHTNAFVGNFNSAREHFERGIALYKPSGLSGRSFYIWDFGVVCLIRSAHVLSFMGFARQAENRCQTALVSAQETSHPFSLACVLACTAWVYQHHGNGRLTSEWSEAAIKLSTENGFPFWRAMGRILRGWALTVGGELGAGIAEIQMGLGEWRATGAKT